MIQQGPVCCNRNDPCKAKRRKALNELSQVQSCTNSCATYSFKEPLNSGDEKWYIVVSLHAHSHWPELHCAIKVLGYCEGRVFIVANVGKENIGCRGEKLPRLISHTFTPLLPLLPGVYQCTSTLSILVL